VPKEIRVRNRLTLEQLRNQYKVEKTIAENLKRATRRERTRIYRVMYDELFKLVPYCSRLKRRENARQTELVNRTKLKLIERFVDKSRILVEFAPGDCTFANDICKRVKFVYGVDISDQRGEGFTKPVNFKLIIYDGYNVKMKEEYADIVFSDQLIEHLHPDDTQFHFQLVKRLLKPRGLYVFRTPHRFSGPHDVSRFFSDKAEGFHLKEWTFCEITKMLMDAEYSSWTTYWFAKGIRIKLPYCYFLILENVLSILPKRIMKIVSKYSIPSITIVAIK